MNGRGFGVKIIVLIAATAKGLMTAASRRQEDLVAWRCFAFLSVASRALLGACMQAGGVPDGYELIDVQLRQYRHHAPTGRGYEAGMQEEGCDPLPHHRSLLA